MLLQGIGVLAASHAIIYKRDHKASLTWVGLILLSPGIGALLYWLFGVNRIKRKAKKIFHSKEKLNVKFNNDEVTEVVSEKNFGNSLSKLSYITNSLVGLPLVSNNGIDLYLNGEKFYPELISEIEKSKRHIYLCSYIFENDNIGKKISTELKKAAARGVTVRVLKFFFCFSQLLIGFWVRIINI